MNLLIDAEEIANAKTGVPRVTFLDTMVLISLFRQVNLHISSQVEKVLQNSYELRIINQFAQQSETKVNVLPNRAQNLGNWILQGFGGLPLKFITDTDYSYSSLFPRMYKTASQQKAIIRLHDPFKKSKDSSQNFLLNRKFKNVIARELRNHAFEKLLNSNSIFIANSFQTRSRFSEIYDTPIDRFKVIWPSVGFRNQVVLKDYKLDTHDNYVICVMSQRQRKNPIFVINSWAKVAAKLKYNLYVVGSIPIEALTAQALHFLNVGRIRILKSVETSELLTLQKNAMASVFASEGEGFGMPLAESMFFGVPVIHNDLDIFMEVCLDAGITFSLKSSDSLISIFEQLGQDEVGYQYKRQQSWEQGEKFSHEYAKTKWERVLGLK